MSLDYHISFLEKPFRRERGSPRYFSDPISSMFPTSRPADVDQAKTDRERVAKEQPEKQRKEVQHQQQQKQSTQAQQAQTLSHTPREELTETREGQAQQHAEGQVLKDASKQGVQELRHSEFAQTQPQQVHTGSAFRAPSSTGGSVLQNIRVLTGEAHPEQTPLMGRGEGSTAPTARDTGSQGVTPDAKGVRLSDIARFAGIQEHGHMPTGASSDPRALRTPFSRAGTPHAQPFTPQSPFSRLADRAFARTWSPDQLTTLLNQAAKTLPESNAALSNRTTNVAVVMHGSLVFVRDGDRVRSFRLLDDGTLYETTHDGEHGGGEAPLSKEARGELTRLLKQKNIHARLHGEKEALTETHGEGKPHLMKDRSLSARGELRSLARDDSSFAHLLREVLEEGGVVAQYLNEGEDAHFPEKSDWVGFFGRMLGMGSEEKSVKKKFDEVLGFMFRGLFKKGESKETLVSDIKYQSSGKTWEAKFAQIGIDNEQLLEFLKSLKPGQSISKEMLQKFFGEEVNFTQLLHVIQKSDPILAGELMKAIKFDPSASVDPFSQARLEHHIFSKSPRRAPFGTPGGGLGDNASPNGGVFANVYDLQPKPKEEVRGKPKLYTVITYVSVVFGLILLLFFLFGR